MKHQEVKELLFKNEAIKAEYDEMETIYEVKNQLIEFRNQLGISQKELAEMVGTKQSAISRLESGNYNPSVEFLSRVAHAMGGHLQISIIKG